MNIRVGAYAETCFYIVPPVIRSANSSDWQVEPQPVSFTYVHANARTYVSLASAILLKGYVKGKTRMYCVQYAHFLTVLACVTAAGTMAMALALAVVPGWS